MKRINLSKMIFMGIPQKTITKDIIIALVNQARKRIHFATSHENALRRNSSGKHLGTFKLPFRESVAPLLEKECGVQLYDSSFEDGKVYCYVESEEEYNSIASFMEKYRTVVFLRDSLELSTALSVNFNAEDQSRTELGQLEYLAKYKGDEDAIAILADQCGEYLRDTPFYNVADCLIAMPSSRSLPAKVASHIKGFSGVVYTDVINWANKQDDLKNADNSIKLDILEKSGLVISGDLDVKDKVVVLLDDLYKSGVTMQYVAMKLKEAGAYMVFGLSLVKSLSDKTDNDDAE